MHVLARGICVATPSKILRCAIEQCDGEIELYINQYAFKPSEIIPDVFLGGGRECPQTSLVKIHFNAFKPSEIVPDVFLGGGGGCPQTSLVSALHALYTQHPYISLASLTSRLCLPTVICTC